MAMLKIIGEYKIDKKIRLGSGTFGKVFKGVHQKRNFDVAAKVLDLGRQNDLEESMPFAMKEVHAMKSVPEHPHILQILYHKITHDYDNDIHELWLVMKYCNTGSLNDYFCNHQPEDEEILKFLQQTADAVAFLHSNGVVHNDLKPSNILLTREIWKPLVKIADFGLSDATNRDYMSVKGGSYHYMAPELFVADASPTHTRKSDVFALGVIIRHLLQTIHGKVLECREVRGDRYLGKVMYENLLKGEKIEDPVQVSSTDSEIQQELKVLAVDMMRPQHRDRPEMEQVHSRLKGVGGQRQSKEINEDPANMGSELKDELDKQEKLLDSLSRFLKACYEGKTAEVMKQLDSDKSLLTETDSSGNSCLYWALSSGNVELFTRLVERGADVRHVNDNDESLLYTACSLQMKNFYSILIEKYHLDGSTKSKKELDCLDAVACNGDIDGFNFLLLLGVPFHSKVIVGAAFEGQLSFVRYLLEQTNLEVDIEAKRENFRQTAAAKAAAKGRFATLKYLVSKGADLFTRDIDEKTCLHLSSQGGHLEVSNFLLAKGLDIHATDKYQRTPLHYAAWNGHLHVAAMLVAKGADLFTRDAGDETCLHLSSLRGHLEMSNFLIAKGLDIHATNKCQRTALHYAAWDGHLQVAAMLVSAGADVNVQDWCGSAGNLIYLVRGKKEDKPAWHYVEVRRNVKESFDKAIGTFDVSDYGKVLKSGWGEEPSQTIKDEIDKYWDDRLKQPDCPPDMTPLHQAIYSKHPSVARMLVERGSDISIWDQFGMTPLMHCALNNDVETARLLLERGVEINATDQDDLTALQIAETNQQKEMVDLLNNPPRPMSLLGRVRYLLGMSSN